MVKDERVDAFILYNEREEIVAKIVAVLESKGVSTFFWHRDIPVGERLEIEEKVYLEAASTVLVVLGAAGWGPNHRRVTDLAIKLNKRILPVVVGPFQVSSASKADRLFTDLRYIDLSNLDDASFQVLVDSIREPVVVANAPNTTRPKQVKKKQGAPQQVSNAENQMSQIDQRFSSYRDDLINKLIDGGEEDRVAVIDLLASPAEIDRNAFGGRLRHEISTQFGAHSSKEMATARRDPSLVPSIRSWLLSALIWNDAEQLESRSLILQHLDQRYEAEESVRFWVLTGLFQVSVSYLQDAVGLVIAQSQRDSAGLLALAMQNPSEGKFIDNCTAALKRGFIYAWPVLRVLRVVSIPALVEPVCQLLRESDETETIVYDIIYALAGPSMATVAAGILGNASDFPRILRMVLRTARTGNQRTKQRFAQFLKAFDQDIVKTLLDQAASDSETSEIAQTLQKDLVQPTQQPEIETKTSSSHYASPINPDTIDVHNDYLDITEDVKTLTAVMIAEHTDPPLAIGLFGPWGSGKTFFMESLMAEIDSVQKANAKKEQSFYCKNIVQIRFNAWHYVDTSLWASLVNNILKCLKDHVAPDPTFEDKKLEIEQEIDTTTKLLEQAHADEAQKQQELLLQQKRADDLRLQREAREITIKDFDVDDLAAMLEDKDKAKMKAVLEEMGLPATMGSVRELADAMSGISTGWGRVSSLFYGITNSKDRIPLLILMGSLMAIPLLGWAIHHLLAATGALSAIGTVVIEFGTTVVGLATVLRKGLKKLNEGIDSVQALKIKVERKIAEKRDEKSSEEKALDKDIEALKDALKAAQDTIATKTVEKASGEKQLEALIDRWSLKNFLIERTNSSDYSKHLGLISTIRQDFESLRERLKAEKKAKSDHYQGVDRIILYIDDLDRCPANKVKDVLQAVHLMLAYPLFIVVVGVDPSWLLRSLKTSYAAFQDEHQADADGEMPWTSTPQDFLEKIFQIPLNLQPMTQRGFARLVDGMLLSPAPNTKLDVAHGQSRPATLEAQEPNDDATVNPENQPDNLGDSTEAIDPSEVAQDAPLPAQTAEALPQQVAVPAIVKPVFIIEEEALTIQARESNFAKQLFRLMPNARSAKRFTNIYRLLKASVDRGQLARFEGTGEELGEFRVPMLLLGLIIGVREDAARLFPILLAAAHAAVARGSKEMDIKVLSQFKAAAMVDVHAMIKAKQIPTDPQLYLRWIPRVARFSFGLHLGSDVGKAEPEKPLQKA